MFYPCAYIFQQGDGNFGIQRIVFRQQDVGVLQGRQRDGAGGDTRLRGTDVCLSDRIGQVKT